jgi:hypothetical protein
MSYQHSSHTGEGTATFWQVAISAQTCARHQFCVGVDDCVWALWQQQSTTSCKDVKLGPRSRDVIRAIILLAGLQDCECHIPIIDRLLSAFP